MKKSCEELVNSKWKDRSSQIGDMSEDELSEMPLCITEKTYKEFKIELSYGGPQDYILLFYNISEKCWDYGEYWYLDWGDGAKIDLDHNECEEIAYKFGVYIYE